MEQTYYLISDAAKQVQVESHVLRYWEEELALPIKRNELGHRYYTEDDIKRFISIKSLKEKGLQLKAIKLVLQDDESFEKEMAEGVETVMAKSSKNVGQAEKKEVMEKKTAEKTEEKVEAHSGGKLPEGKLAEGKLPEEKGKKIISVITKTSLEADNKNDKVMRMQMLLRQMIAEAVRDNNDELCENLRDSIVKELDYQFRTLEEREEVRENSRAQKEEEHYKKIDELLRSRSGEKVKSFKKTKEEKKEKKEKKRRHSFF